MATTPARVLYATQNAVIYPTSGVQTGAAGNITGGYALALNSVSLDITNPIENVLVFGQLGAAARVQKEPSKTKISLKTYLTTGTPSGCLPFDYLAIGVLTGNALAGTYSRIVVEPNGFTGYGILTSLGIDASTNNFVTLDLSFEGVGTPTISPYPTGISNSAYNLSLPIVTSVSPVTSNLVAAGVISVDPLFTGALGTLINASGVNGCVTSAKFSLDIPNDMISCLGAEITGLQVLVSQGNVMVAKPPFKTSLVVEGTSANACDSVDFGPLLVTLPNTRLVSQTINQAVGNVGQTYNYTIEDLTANFQYSILRGTGLGGNAEPNLNPDA